MTSQKIDRLEIRKDEGQRRNCNLANNESREKHSRVKVGEADFFLVGLEARLRTVQGAKKLRSRRSTSQSKTAAFGNKLQFYYNFHRRDAQTNTER